jgi:hypothetical protein
MFPVWRLQLRAARLAVADGRWDEAAEVLCRESLRDFLPVKQLSQQLADRLVERAEQRLTTGQSSAGWRDLKQAAQLGAAEATVSDFRQRQTQLRLERIARMLARGETAVARQQLAGMEQRNLGGADRRSWQAIAEHMESADQRVRKGDLGAAIGSLELAQRTLPTAHHGVADHLQVRLATLHEQAGHMATLDSRLHAALKAADWTEVLASAEALLELAPQHSAARQARAKAWNAVGLEVTQAYRPSPAKRFRDVTALHCPEGARGEPNAGPPRGRGIDTAGQNEMGKRLVAWIDAVGGYLVCLGDEIVLGQPCADGGVDVPILADLSRRHAVIRRQGESYVLTPIHRVAVDGRQVVEPTVLRDKCLVKLGSSVELRFRRPHALSATAVLEPVNRIRTEPAVDAIVLMSESCVLGPGPQCHIRCRSWSGELVLFRRGDELLCRSKTPIAVDESQATHAILTGNSRIAGDDFALSLEEL